MSSNRTPDPTAQAARIKELEAALARQAPPPATGFAAIYQLLNTVLGIFPRWLIITAAAVILCIVAWGAYNAAIILDMQRRIATNPSYEVSPPTAAERAARTARLKKVQATCATDGGPGNPELDPLPFGSIRRPDRSAGAPLPPCVALDPLM